MVNNQARQGQERRTEKQGGAEICRHGCGCCPTYVVVFQRRFAEKQKWNLSTDRNCYLVGGPDPTLNMRLAAAIENASKANVPKKTIESAIKRGSGTGGGSSGPSEMALYEGIGPGGVAFVVEALTDNKARTVSQVKAAFSKSGGVLSPSAYLFTRRGWVEVWPKQGEDFDTAFEKLIDLGAEDLEQKLPGEENGDEEFYVVYTGVQETAKVAEALKNEGYGIKDLGIEYAPNEDTMVESLAADSKAAFEKLCAQLDDIDDVVEMYTNLK